MDAIDLALRDAWERLTPALRTDRLELARRLARRHRPTLTRPIRPWCLCIRAADTRINRLNAIIAPRHARRDAQPHHVVLSADTLRLLTKPVRIDWPGIPATDAAARLGRHVEAIRPWIRRGLFQVRYDNARALGRRGKPVPIIWSPSPLDPSANHAQAPDPLWGTLWQSHWQSIPDDMEITLERTPIFRPEPRSFRPKALLRGWHFTCPGRLTPVPRALATAKSGPIAAIPRLRCMYSEDAPIESRPVLDAPALLEDRDHFYLYHPCGRPSARLFMPLPVWTLAHALGFPDDDAQTVTNSIPAPALSLRLSVSSSLPSAPAVRSFACHHCWRLRYFSLISRNGWNQFVTHLTAGLLRGGEVPRPADLAPARRKRRYARHMRPAPRQDQVAALIAEGLTSKQIAHRLGIAYSTVVASIKALYKKHNARTRAALCAKLGLAYQRPLPPRRAQVLCLLLHGHSYKQIAARLNIKYATVHGHTKALYRTYQVHSRRELTAKLVRPTTQSTLRLAR